MKGWLGIFFNDNGMTTSIVLANHNPLFRDTDESGIQISYKLFQKMDKLLPT